LDANIPGLMIVDSSPAAAISRSISACSTAIGFGCWKNGCEVWHGEVAGDDLDVRWQLRRLGATRQGADRHARGYQRVDHGPPDPAGRSGNEHAHGVNHASFPTLTGGLMALMMTLCPSCQRGAGGLGVRATVNPGARVPPGAGDAP
jgi:hypothetical protein